MSSSEIKRIGDLLVTKGLITSDQLSDALEHQKTTPKRLGEILIDKGYVDQMALVRMLASQFHLPFVSLEEEEIDDKALAAIPPAKAREWNIFPFRLREGVLTVAVTNPLDVTLFHELRYLTGFKINPVVACPEDINNFTSRYFGASHNIEEAILDADKDALASTGSQVADQGDVDQAPVVQLARTIISDAIKLHASDIHLEPQRKDLRVRYRIDGVLKETLRVPKKIQITLTSRIKIISGMDIAESRRPQDGRLQVEMDKKKYDLRVSTLPDAFGEKIVLRILDKENINLTLESLGLDARNLKFLREAVKTPYGIILVTGPTGSGKSTSLYCMLGEINDESRNIVTLEDPIEYEIDGINQTAINNLAGYTFAKGMRHILRQDPDVIMVGEIRDTETAEIAVQSALTGHLVLSTLHTNNAAGAVMRLLDMEVEPFLISSSVVAVIAQRLLRRLCSHCKKPAVLSDNLKKMMEGYSPGFSQKNFFTAVGCEKCNNIGYRGRTGIFEIMNVTPEIKDMILRKPTEREVEEVAISQGMHSLQKNAIEKAIAGETTLEEVARVTFVKRI
ncbi:MAG: GspE/PulE family protein [Candidatus Omnitrophica bacterium]|nr:GspE/PulE family protein [Candidatus Omnitrophota bacterium]